MIIRKYLVLGVLCVIVSASILVAAIVGSKHHHPSDDPSSSDPNPQNSIVSRHQPPTDNSFGTFPDRSKNPWNRTPYSAVAIFGASDCDDAHPRSSIYADTIRPAPYWQGRFTNGPVFGEYLAASTLTGKSISSLNYAYGDATVNNQLVKVNAPDTRTQMEMYVKDISDGKIQRGNSKDGRILHCVWIGINDIIQIWTDVIKNGTFQNGNVNGHQNGFEHAVDRVKLEAKELIDQIQSLRSNPVVNQIKSDFLLLFLPPLEIVPNLHYQSRDLASKNSTLANIYLDYIGKLTGLYNSELGSGIENLQQEKRQSDSRSTPSDSFSTVNIKYFDIPKYWYFVRNNPDKYNFVNVIDACWNSTTGVNCKDPARWEYYDTLHPTTKMHEYLAQEITVQVNL